MSQIQAKYLTVLHAAALLDAPPSTVYDWIKRGAIPAIEIAPGRWRIDREALERHLAMKSTVVNVTPVSLIEKDLMAKADTIYNRRVRSNQPTRLRRSNHV